MSKIIKDNQEKTKKLRIKNIDKEYVGKGIVNIDPNVIKELNLKNNDVIEIFNRNKNKKTAALLNSGMQEDLDSQTIRLGPALRRNLNAEINDVVEIRKIEVKLAEQVILAGLAKDIILKNPDQLAEKLKGRKITKGDILSFNSSGRKIDLIVIDYFPKVEAIKVHKKTKIVFQENRKNETIEKDWYELYKQKEAEIQMLLKRNIELENKIKKLNATEGSYRSFLDR